MRLRSCSSFTKVPCATPLGAVSELPLALDRSAPNGAWKPAELVLGTALVRGGELLRAGAADRDRTGLAAAPGGPGGCGCARARSPTWIPAVSL
jgi:hypothetical protein